MVLQQQINLDAKDKKNEFYSELKQLNLKPNADLKVQKAKAK